MASNEMIKRAYAEGAYAALKEAGYDHQTAVQYAVEMTKQAEGIPPATAASPPDISALLAQRKPAVPVGGTARMQDILSKSKGNAPPRPSSLNPALAPKPAF